jgi:hypothetical protein
MGDYLELQNGGPVKVRVHRRVLAGLEREASAELRGIVLGSASVENGEVLVEDFEPVNPDSDREFVTRDTHFLPTVGYFRAGPGEQLQITPDDRDLFAKYFPEPQDVLLLFALRNGTARLAHVYAKSGGMLEEIRPPELLGVPPMPAFRRLPPGRSAFRRHEPESPPPKPSRGYLWPVLAVVVGVLLGVGGAAYFGTHRGAARQPTANASGAASRPPARTPAPATPALSDADRSLEVPKAAPSQSAAEVQRDIRALLSRWTDSLLDDDIDAHAATYAPSVAPYFTKSRVSRQQVRDEIRRTRDRYGKMTVYKISNVTIAPVDATHAIANFRKRWETANRKFSGEEREQLKFVREGTNWLISSEQELKVYWVRKR